MIGAGIGYWYYLHIFISTDDAYVSGYVGDGRGPGAGPGGQGAGGQ